MGFPVGDYVNISNRKRHFI